VVEAMLQVKEYRHYPMACISAWIRPAILLDQIKVFFDERGLPAGYLTWAYLAPDVEERWITDPTFIPHLSEWCEGGSLWIMSFVAPSGYAREMIGYAKAHLFKDFVVAKSLRRGGDGVVRRISRWRR